MTLNEMLLTIVMLTLLIWLAVDTTYKLELIRVIRRRHNGELP